MNLHLVRPFNRTTDKLRLELSFDSATLRNPNLDDGSLVYTPIVLDETLADNSSSNVDSNPLKYEAKIKSISPSGQILTVDLRLAPTMPIGLWRLRISSKLASSQVADSDSPQVMPIITYTVREILYILFNPWNIYDDVYLSQEDARREYLLNEVGKIYVGSYANSVGKKWFYGQFDDSVLPVLMHLLDKTRLTVADRSSAVRVSRAVSAVVNSHDENGLLAGNWSGNYGDGLAPWYWNGSPKIFQRYIQNGYQTVKFGQCWVFGGVTTTSLRALGIPARSVSNFVSAHDTDSSLTVDKFLSNYGSELTGVNGDSIWNFHVWSEAWMQRPDLPPNYGGWQVIDATPQEQSMGMYQLGPASLEAVKRGKTSYAYDVSFVFSEVNANVVYWHQDGRTRLKWRASKVLFGHFGRKILTKMIGVIDEWSRSGLTDAENIVHLYKYPDGTPESKLARAEAAKAAGLQPLFDHIQS